MRFIKILTNNFLPKLIALILAISTWFYVFDMVNSDSFLQKKESVEEVFSRYEFVVKKLPVKPVFFGRSPEGYKIRFDKVKVVPSDITVFGPREILDNVAEIQTDKINLGEYTRSVRLRLGIRSNTKLLRMEERVVDVFLLVESENNGVAEKVSKEVEAVVAVEE